MKLSYSIIGTDALGGYYGGRLANAGHEVHFLFHSDYQFVKENGLQVDSVNGDFIVKPINAYGSTLQMPKCDVVLVCLKTTQNHLLKDLLPPLLHKDTVVVLVQNGLGLEAELAETFPDLSIAGGLAFICSSKIGDGHIGHFDFGKITVGAFQHENKQVLKQICQDFEEAGVPSEYSADLNESRWKKLVWNIPYNGMTVVLNTSTNNLMKNPASRQLIYEIMLEVIEAAHYCGVNIPKEFADQMITSTDEMTPYAPSMKLDFDAQRPMEISAIYTNPFNIAKKAGYSMSKVFMLGKQLRFLDAFNQKSPRSTE
jgi:2-dehydropantoate 2-reductase